LSQTDMWSLYKSDLQFSSCQAGFSFILQLNYLAKALSLEVALSY